MAVAQVVSGTGVEAGTMDAAVAVVIAVAVCLGKAGR